MQRILSNKEFWVVLFLLVLAITLRLPTLGSPLIEDEAISFNRYIDVPWEDLIFSYYEPNQHTFFLLLSKFCIWIFGESEITYRLPSFLAGVLSIPLIYRLGLLIKIPWSSALISALLMGLSWPHLKYSLEGRSYALTIFLALLVTYSTIQYLNSSRWVWGSILVGSGFAMAMALPSNLFFLCGLAVFIIIQGYIESKKTKFSIKNISKSSIPFLIIFAIIGVYFLKIYEGLRLGKQFYSQPLAETQITNIAGLLVAPWGFWMYLFFALGVWRLRLAKERVLLISVFLVPILLTLLTGTVGFGRTYVYWLPFILLLSAYGMTEFFFSVLKQIRGLSYGLGVGVVFLLILSPAKKISKHYENRNNGSLVVGGPNATMSEASQMAFWAEENIPKDSLIVISTGGPESSVLNRYMNKEVLERMIHIARGGKLKKIIFIAHQDMPPEKYPFVSMVQDRKLKLPKSKIKKIYSLGNLGVYELDLKIEQFVPSTYDPDYEGKIGNFNTPGIVAKQIEKPKVVGGKALYIDNKSGEVIDLISPIVKGLDISEDHAYLLYIYIANFKPFKDAVLHLAEIINWPPKIGYLNPFLGMFRGRDSADTWNISYSLSPLSKGRHYLQERIGLNHGVHYYDGLQSYLLTE
jgi:hypothetical protein